MSRVVQAGLEGNQNAVLKKGIERYWFTAIIVICWVGFSLNGLHQKDACAQEIQRVEIASSPNPVGSGARALGIGAFIAVADDATAASWNPGGLIQLESPEISMVGAAYHRIEDNRFKTNPEASGSQSISEENINYLSIAYPFNFFNRNMIVSFNYQNLYDFNREWDFPLHQQSSRASIDNRLHFLQTGNLAALGLAYCIQMTPQLSFGVTLNFWEDWFGGNSWEQTLTEKGTGTYSDLPVAIDTTYHEKFKFSGFNANLGMMWNVNSNLTIGAVFKTPFTADLKHQSSFNSPIRFLTFPEANSTFTDMFEQNEHLDMPMAYGIGIAYRFSDAFTIAADIYRTEWQDFIRTDSQGNKTSPVTGKDPDRSDIDPTHQIRVGAEYLFIRNTYIIPLRAGLYYDPSPAEGSPDDYYGVSLGSGFAYKRFVFDIAYRYRFGTDVGSAIVQGYDFSQDVAEHALYSSIIIHF